MYINNHALHCVCTVYSVFFLFLGFESLLEANRYHELSLLYQFFGRFKDGIPLVHKGFGEYIKVRHFFTVHVIHVYH